MLEPQTAPSPGNTEHVRSARRPGGRIATSLIVLVLLSHVAACEAEPTPNGSTSTQSATSSRPMAELERVCGVPHDATAEFTERRRERFDYKETKRVAVRIVVAPGMSREELARTMRVALVRSYRTELNSLGSVGAIDVLAYASDAVDGAFSAARGTLAPEGDWSKASETVPLSEWSVRIEYAEGYFAAKHAQAVPGDTLVILGEAGDQIALSREPARWNDQDIVTRVAPGTKVQVIAVKAFPMAGGRELMRLKVKTIGAAPRTGWVHASATSRPLTDG